MSSFLGRLKQRLFYSPLIPSILKETRECRGELYRLNDLERRMKSMQEALGRIEARQTAALQDAGLRAHEFKVYSQWGEDGIIQYLIRQIPVSRKVFVEFGVESYEESNTRFLLVNNNWSGLVIDADETQVTRIRQSREYWLYNLKAVASFITRDNINETLRQNGIEGEIGLLSIDIDGMDYWIWKSIDVISPAIVVIEYNHLFGADDAVTVPYEDKFDRRSKHHSLLYYGASLKALQLLGESKGYALVGCGSAGLNAFFVRRDLLPSGMRALETREAFVPGQFCEAHDDSGRRIKADISEESRIISGLPLVHTDGKKNGAG